MRKFWCLLLLLVFVLHGECGSINMKIAGHDAECLFIPKTKGDMIEVVVSVSGASDNTKIDFRAFKPNMQDEIVSEHEIIDYELNPPLKADETGDYMYCFYNTHSMFPVVVSFEYDISLEEDEHEVSEGGVLKRVAKEKKNLLVRTIDQIRATMTPGQGKKETLEQKKHQLWDLLKNNIRSVNTAHLNEEQQNQAIKDHLLLLGVYFDRIETYLDLHKNKLRRHHHLQEANNWNVMFYSILICCAMVIASLVQLIVLKGFINGKMSWKVWQF